MNGGGFVIGKKSRVGGHVGRMEEGRRAARAMVGRLDTQSAFGFKCNQVPRARLIFGLHHVPDSGALLVLQDGRIV